VTRYLSKLSFWKKKDRSDADIKPDFVYGYSLQKPIFFNPVDPVMLWLKTSFFLGLLIALPLILYQVWAFIAPGLMASEKKVIVPILAFACILFPTGASIAYLGFRMVLSFLLTFQIARMEPTINVYSLLGLEIKLMVGFGVAFELPIVIMFLTMLGLVTPARLREWRSYAIVINAIIAAILTPTADPGTMLLMMVPLVILYEISIFASIPIARKRAQADREIEEADEEVRSVEADAYEQLQAPTVPGEASGTPAPPEGETEPTVSTETASDDEPVVGPYPGYAEAAYPQSYYEPPQTEISSPPESAPAEVYYAEPRDQRREDRKRWKRKQLRRMRYRPDEEEF
jgi:sec-independent protein translocase protein TatC